MVAAKFDGRVKFLYGGIVEPAFRTEHEMEAYLVNETRLLAWPDGTMRPHTDFRLTWLVFDDLVRLRGYKPEELVNFAVQETAHSGQPFVVTFPGVLAYMEAHLLRRN